MHLELSKPWINSYLKNQIYIKYQLKDASANSKNLSDFEKFQEQRTNVDKLTAMAKEAYFRLHPDEVNDAPVTFSSLSTFNDTIFVLLPKQHVAFIAKILS